MDGVITNYCLEEKNCTGPGKQAWKTLFRTISVLQQRRENLNFAETKGQRVGWANEKY